MCSVNERHPALHGKNSNRARLRGLVSNSGALVISACGHAVILTRVSGVALYWRNIVIYCVNNENAKKVSYYSSRCIVIVKRCNFAHTVCNN